MRLTDRFGCFVVTMCIAIPITPAAEKRPQANATPSSLIEDRAAGKLLEAGKARYEADEPAKAVEIWQSVIERYPRSRVRFAAHLALGDHFLDRERAYDRARVHFEVAAGEENRDEDQRAQAAMRTGVCYYQLRNYGKCFQVMRDVIDQFPGNFVVNDAWYYIGLGHFQLGHYGRAIAALENVGTAVTSNKGKTEKLEAGKRLFVRIEDADLAILGPKQGIDVLCEAASGDRETIPCFPISRHARLAVGSIPTRLGKPFPGDDQLQIKGDDSVTITYADQHNSDRQADRKVNQTVAVVGTADVRITDGAFQETLLGVVLGKELNLQVIDGDRDLTDGADSVHAVVSVYRAKEEGPSETDQETAPRAEGSIAPAAPPGEESSTLTELDHCQIVLTEVPSPRRARDVLAEPSVEAAATPTNGQKTEPASTGLASPPAAKDESSKPTPEAESPTGETQSRSGTSVTGIAGPPNDSVHSGIFRMSIPLQKAEQVARDDDKLQALPGDTIKIVYLDERHGGEGVREVLAQARCLEGNIGGVRISQAQISDQELRIQTQLKTASALTNIGNRYKEFGLKQNAEAKYQQALDVCEEIMKDAAKLGGHVLEETYVQLWRIYFEMERLHLAAAMCQRLQRQFPSSGFVDEALLQLAEVARKQKDLPRAIQTYSSLLAVRTSPLRGEAQFGIAQCYDQMAQDAEETNAAGLRARAFEAYKKVFDQFPDSGRVGDAVAKMASYYYDQKDYTRAVDVFENVLRNYPDAKFLDVILFNYGRCLYRMGRKAEALARFEQLLAEAPDSSLAADTKKIVLAMRGAGK